MLLAIIAAVLAYQKAKASGRNPWLWAFIGVAVYIGVQLLIGVAAGLLILVGVALFGWSESAFTSYEMVINIVAIIGALAATWVLLKYLDRLPPEEAYLSPPPPPPPSFGNQQPAEGNVDLHGDNR